MYGKKIPVVVMVLFISDKKLSSLVFSYLVSVSGSCRADVANKIFTISKSKSKSKHMRMGKSMGMSMSMIVSMSMSKSKSKSKSKTISKKARVVQEQQGEHEQ